MQVRSPYEKDNQRLDNQLFRGDTLGDDRLEGKTFDFLCSQIHLSESTGARKKG